LEDTLYPQRVDADGNSVDVFLPPIAIK